MEGKRQIGWQSNGKHKREEEMGMRPNQIGRETEREYQNLLCIRACRADGT